ncbi:MAG: hypothetical protein U0637_14410 [Phycisphaerales bacterium]
MLTLRALWELFRLGWITRFRMSGLYWRWRTGTALGPRGADAVSAAERRRAVLEYGRWVARMRR